jgi:3-methyladenine DNA glycosylase AlkD
MTAIGESNLRVLNYGDAAGADSRGLFQQRDNGAWGTLADRMNPFVSATHFYESLVNVDNWATLDPSLAAHRVQANSDPAYYDPFWPQAQEIVTALTPQ